VTDKTITLDQFAQLFIDPALKGEERFRALPTEEVLRAAYAVYEKTTVGPIYNYGAWRMLVCAEALTKTEQSQQSEGRQ